ncbi:TetR family transcriptional regulator C-terminal domain-containing protein [Rhizobium alvei]|jgi:AcrR family transcriptional regulator|uniref:TetR family transcriptional regulator C-terminal domain-containing protein n=1 Tax=Rhizobium alvei TaxID=1132659 RepID=A0ABT8YSU2_9HYPH|nr:TetR family transcriptional regulator C-terminal domain-containing protein [Rhizobium alvei]MDO6966280.1 TetR family transcriptional regulator C-terminal domain-containing protein [Rhizobium alvei]
MTRRPFRHESEDVRRQDLIAATLDCIADYGIQGATVRQIAERAGVTPGLIRHYFVSKERMFQTAYREIMNTMFETASKASEEHGSDAIGRLKVFVLANFRPPIIDPRMLSLWATFISQIGVDPELASIHREGYLAFRDRLETLLQDVLTEAGRKPNQDDCRRMAIAINGMIDGLWLEGCMAGSLFREQELGDIALASVATLLGIDFDKAS